MSARASPGARDVEFILNPGLILIQDIYKKRVWYLAAPSPGLAMVG